AAVLAALDRDRYLAGVGAQPDFRAAIAGVRRVGDVDRQLAVGDTQRHRHGERGRLGARLVDRLFDGRFVAAERVRNAVDDGLRRVDFAVATRLRIGLLAHRVAVQGQGVLPTEIVPVIDRQAQHHQRGVTAQLAEQLVRGRTARAALTGEEFDDRAARPR